MRSFIDVYLLFTMLLCCQFHGRAQSLQRLPPSQKYDYHKYDNDPCGDPRVESMLWTSAVGKVVKVVDGDRIVISLKSGKRLLVHLVGIDAPSVNQAFGYEAQQFLKRRVLGKLVDVWVNPSSWNFKNYRPKEITGVVHLRGADLQDINLSMIHAGMARHRKSEPYTMSNYSECQYGRAESEARKARSGLWRDAA